MQATKIIDITITCKHPNGEEYTTTIIERACDVDLAMWGACLDAMPVWP